MRRSKLILATGLVLVASCAIVTPGAHADAYSCTFTGAAGAFKPGVQPLVADLQENNRDGLWPVRDPLTDTDAGNGDQEATGVDGTYDLESDPLTTQCAYVDDDEPANSGVYEGTLSSLGEYNSYFCGTGWMVEDDNFVPTTLTFDDPRAADLLAIEYRLDTVSGAGVLGISNAVNEKGQSGDGDGTATIVPIIGDCVTTPVTMFGVAGSFAARLPRGISL